MTEDHTAYGEKDSALSVEHTRRTAPFQMDIDHYHDVYEVYMLLEGERRYFIRDRSYLIKEGDLVFIGQGDLHKTSDGSTPQHERIVFYFDNAFVQRHGGPDGDFLLSPFRRSHPVCRLDLKNRMAALAAAGRLVHEMKNRGPGSGLAIRQNVLDLLLLCARHTSGAEEEQPVLDTPLYRKMSEVARYINDHYPEPLPLTWLAEHFHMSPSYLSRMFRQATGFALNEYINIIRVREAERLLKETSLSVLEISLAAGFNNFSHFGKTFKRHAKMSPREYRGAR